MAEGGCWALLTRRGKGSLNHFQAFGAAITVLQLMRRPCPLETSNDINDWPPLDSEEHL